MNYEPSESPGGTAVISPSREPTTTTLQPLSVAGAPGTVTNFVGKLTDSKGSGVPNKIIHFFVTDIEVLTAITDPNGDYSFQYTWELQGTYPYKTKYLG